MKDSLTFTLLPKSNAFIFAKNVRCFCIAKDPHSLGGKERMFLHT